MKMIKRGIKRGQISFEYMIVIGFVTFVIVGILALAFVYSGGIKDSVKTTQIQNCMNKIISASETVYYSGYPSKSTIKCYLPDNVNDISIRGNALYINFQTSSGINSVSYPSEVPINSTSVSGSLGKVQGLRKIKIEAFDGNATISLA